MLCQGGANNCLVQKLSQRTAKWQAVGGAPVADLERNGSRADRFRSGVQWVNELLSLTSARSR